MITESANVLEFPAALAILDRYARTPAGHARIRALSPGKDRALLERAFVLAGEAVAYLRDASAGKSGVLRLDFYGIGDVGKILPQLRIEDVALDPREVAEILLMLDRAVDFRQIIENVREKYPALAGVARQTGDFRALLREMAGKIRPDGTLDDNASPALHRLRREIEKQQTAIHKSLERFLEREGDQGSLQEELVTIRNDRFVVPVKAGKKRRIDGVIHGASSSGQTLFIEPLETIEHNNELAALRESELQEVHRILREMSARLRERVHEIAAALDAVTELDVVFAKGSFATEFDCTMPRFSSVLRLKQARHPVLVDVMRSRKARVVPLSLELDHNNRVLVISGPNTGGKTVALKTVGLLALTAQAGIPVCATEAELPLFDQVLADIGDFQSIENNLSTFSAHLTNIQAMTECVTSGSLVLFDELGSATDPQEGGALAVAITEHFLKAGAFTIASTHHLGLKAYATNTPGVVNASVGFDESTLQPTYRLLAGVPGKSSGLAIAQRLGLHPAILERAKQALTSQDEEVGRFLARLHASVEESERLREEVRRLQHELKEQTKELAAVWEKREKAKLAELEKKLGGVLAQVENDSRAAIEKITEKQARREAERALSEAKREGRDQFNTAVVEHLGTAPAAPPPSLPREIGVGMTVRLRGLGSVGKVVRKVDGELFEIEMGLMKTRARASELEPTAAAAPARPQQQKVSVVLDAAVVEINVIGCTADEACDRVDKFLDTSVLSCIPRVRVIHGHGKGVLRKALGEMFSSHPHVERSYPAEQKEGGTGATIVELRI